MLSLRAAEAKKLLVDDKITACVKEICLVGIVCKVSNRKALSCETFCFSEKHLLNFVLRVIRAPFTRQKIFGAAWMKVARVSKK